MTVISYNGDSFSVASAALAGIGDDLNRLATGCEAEHWYPAGSDELVSALFIGGGAAEASLLIETLRLAAGSAAMLADHLRLAQDWYEQADATVREAIMMVSDEIVANIATTVVGLATIGAGAVIGALASPAGMAIAFTVIGTGILAHHAGVLPEPDAVASWGSDVLAPVLASPMGALAVRAFVSAGDEIVTGLAGFQLRTPIGTPIRAPGGFDSPQTVSGSISAMTDRIDGRSEFDLRSEPRDPAAAPESIAEVVGSIPPSVDGEPQVVITEYLAADGSTTYLVSVAGTSSAGYGGDNVFDLRGNVAAYGALDRESVAAVDAVMREHGITADDAVVFAGYSQGALVTTALAASGDWSTQSMVTIGSPTHGNVVPGDVPIVQIEHANDPIVALNGLPQAPANDVSVVVRNPHPQGIGPGGDPLAGHAFDTYLTTAGEYDALTDPQDIAHREQVLAPLAGATAGSATAYTITREPKGGTP